MNGNNRLLGWIAIGIGVLALFVALGGRAREWRMAHVGPYGYNNGGYGQQWQGPRGDFGPGAFDRGNGFGPNAPFGPHEGFGHGPRFGGHHGHGFFFFPFMLIGGLFRLLMFGLIAFVLLRWLGRRRHGHHHHHHHHEHGGQQGPPQPTSEPKPYTGETTNL